MKTSSKILIIAFSIFTFSILSGCASPGATAPDPSSINAQLNAGDQLNHDINGRPSPLVTRFYELKSLSIFNSSDFFTLYERDVAVLGGELLARDELRFQPGEKKKLIRNLNPDTRFIGIIGAYRNIENATWRKSIKVDLNKKTSFMVEFGQSAIDIKKAGK
jgi:type VI secretion system protein VasD